MLQLQSVIAVATGAVLVYLGGIFVELPLEWVFAFYGLATGTTVWMVVRILKDPSTTEKTFDDYFYQDRPDLRRSGKE
jgi:hypothetical protein